MTMHLIEVTYEQMAELFSTTESLRPLANQEKAIKAIKKDVINRCEFIGSASQRESS